MIGMGTRGQVTLDVVSEELRFYLDKNFSAAKYEVRRYIEGKDEVLEVRAPGKNWFGRPHSPELTIVRPTSSHDGYVTGQIRFDMGKNKIFDPRSVSEVIDGVYRSKRAEEDSRSKLKLIVNNQ